MPVIGSPLQSLALAMLLMPVPASAQPLTSSEYLGLSPADRAHAETLMRGQAEKSAQAVADLKALREKLLRTPPLQTGLNALLGQWKVEGRPRKADALADAFDTLVKMDRAKCEMLFGAGGVIEFRANDWAGIDSYGKDSLGSVEYRGDSKRVWVIPERSISTGTLFLAFDFVGPNRVNVLTPSVNKDCSLNRLGDPAQPTQGASATRPLAAPNRAPSRPSAQTANASPARPISRRPPPEVCQQTLLDKLGVVGVNQVRAMSDVRFEEAAIEGTVPNSRNLRIDLRGSACDDPRIKATLYDFDADGMLQSITYVWERPAGPPPAPIFLERLKTLALVNPDLPQPQLPGRLQADTSIGRLVLQDMPERNLLLEAYAAKK